MAETKIEWADYTFNPWRGCQKVSPGCEHCYADTMSKRNPATLGVWGPMGTRVVAAESYWKLPERWNRAAATGTCHVCLGLGMAKQKRCPACNCTGKRGDGTPYRARVFCASLADVFENWTGAMMGTNGRQLWYADDGWTDEPGGRTLDMDHVRQRLFRLIDATPNLDWLILTKRPENIARMMGTFFVPIPKPCADHVERAVATCSVCRRSEPPFYRPNVWLGTSVENQATADERIPHLLRVPAAVRFLSMEPLLGRVDLSRPVEVGRRRGLEDAGLPPRLAADVESTFATLDGIDWTIAGGESGPNARPLHPDWVRSIRDQCQAAGVPLFVKQMGGVRDKRGDLDDLPDDLRIRQFPEAAHA